MDPSRNRDLEKMSGSEHDQALVCDLMRTSESMVIMTARLLLHNRRMPKSLMVINFLATVSFSARPYSRRSSNSPV